MDNENELPLSKVLENIFHSFFKIFSDISLLAKTEARLAKQSMVMLVFMAFFMLALLTTTWLCLLGLIIAYLLYLKTSLLLSILTVTVLNLSLVFILGACMLKLKDNLLFRATRRQLDNTKNLLKGSTYGKTPASN